MYVQPVDGEHSRGGGQQPGTVGRHHHDLEHRVVRQRVDRHVVVVREREKSPLTVGEGGRARRTPAAVDRHRPLHQVAHQPCLPRAPGRRAGGECVGLGQGVQQAEDPGAAGGPGHRLDGRRVVDVPPGRGLDEQEVLAHHRDQHVGVRRREPEPWREIVDDLDSHVGVVAGPALADVVQQGAEQQQVGPVDLAGRRRRGGGCLQQVPVDGEAVVGIALRPAAHRLPLGQQPDEQPDLVECLHGADHGWAGGEQGHQGLPCRVRPRCRHGWGFAGKPVEGVSADGDAGPGRRGGGPQDQRGIAGGIGVPSELRLAVLLDHVLVEGPADRGAGAPARGRAQACRDPVPGGVPGPGDRTARVGGGVGERELVGIAQSGRDGGLVLQQQPVLPAAVREPADLATGVEEHPVRFEYPRGRGLGGPRGGERGQGMDVPQTTAGLFQVRFEQEGDVAVAAGPVGDQVREFGQAMGGAGPPTGADALEQRPHEDAVTGDRAGRQQAQRCLQVVVGDRDGLVDGTDAVVEADPGVPERIPEGVGDAGDVVPAAVV